MCTSDSATLLQTPDATPLYASLFCTARRTASSKLSSCSPTKPIASLSVFSYSVPPSPQILLKVAAVAIGAPSAHSFSSTSRSVSSEVYWAVHFVPVCFSNVARISLGVTTNDWILRARSRAASGCRSAAATPFPTLWTFRQHACNATLACCLGEPASRCFS